MRANNICSMGMRSTEMHSVQTRANEIVPCTFARLEGNWLRNDWESVGMNMKILLMTVIDWCCEWTKRWVPC